MRTLRTYRITTPRTGLVLDTAVTSALTEAEARRDAAQYTVAVSLDGRSVRNPAGYWVFYRNNGPQICRIYFPGDLGSLNMGANSLVLRPLPPGKHLLHVVVRQRIAGTPPATLVTDYVLRVLDRAAERARAAERTARRLESCGARQQAARAPHAARLTVARGGPMTELNETTAQFLEQPFVGTVTTLRKDGSPHSTIVWVDVVDGEPSFNTAYGRKKPANLERDPRVSLLVVDPGDTYKWLAVDGKAELTTDGADAQIDKLAKKYLGKD